MYVSHLCANTGIRRRDATWRAACNVFLYTFPEGPMKKLLVLVALVLALGSGVVSACSHGAPPTPPPEQNDFGA